MNLLSLPPGHPNHTVWTRQLAAGGYIWRAVDTHPQYDDVGQCLGQPVL
jgi:hypothetical protein